MYKWGTNKIMDVSIDGSTKEEKRKEENINATQLVLIPRVLH